ncbi:hypothetical protein SPRG_02242 [Saprolegnia parasitica CBS 223.65]|uniref:Uncharacterized protein n=1 Tax=Saprolegnia parasitica (strain CBS 223.65) TaxID=695850 RepID=A0A067CVZ2_SAPPC|nr:hypothetical protein SPRG_02242 [Saprolegnia parasitica CBS 223.65]KDO33435.1 hypothetical protein SPRG_02242 [Saprolegnia parasitica CBS 223.65]|eukprot:XP_012196181.1 hypothetical protein SPRG_02242 [Saprolegnia parasitica CBS 223.65]
MGLDADVPLTWHRVLLACSSYVLFFTDIPRSGFGFKTLPKGYHAATETLYANFGPYSYPIMTMTKQADGSVTGSVPLAKVWSYKFDTCSLGLRTVVSQRNVSGWDPCLLYASECTGDMLLPGEVFIMLENVARTIQHMPSQSWRIYFNFVDIINDMFAFGTFKERDWRTLRTHYIPSPDVNVCAVDYATRPYFCEQPWTDFGALGVPGMTSIVDDIQRRMALAANASDARTQRVDMAFVEAIDDLRPWDGGLARTSLSPFDVITLLRVQNCSDPARALNCSTVELTDHRYEGGFGSTDTLRYYKLLFYLRLFGQLYNIGRAIALFVGCYAARAVEASYKNASLQRRLYAALTMYLRIPAQVVIYGSWFPVLLFATAHLIDAPFLYFTIFIDLATINGTYYLDAEKVYTFSILLTCHMRNVWLLSLVTKGMLLLMDPRHPHGILGVRGYLLPLVSFFSILFEIRLKALRNTELLHVLPSVPSASTQLLRGLHSVPSNYRYWGVYSDVKTLSLSFVAIFILGRLLLRLALTFQTDVPYTLLRYCNRTMFSTAWHAPLDGLRSTSLHRVHTQADLASQRCSRNRLMHVTWMTDPIQYLCLLWNQPIVYVYKSKTSAARVHHVFSPRELQTKDPTLHATLDCVGEALLLDLPWAQRIQCY